MIKRILAAVVIVVGATTGALAQNLDVIKERQQAFKDMLPHAKAGRTLVQGKTEFDLTKARAVYAGLAGAAVRLPGLWPEDSKTGADTEALPVIWEKKDDFLALVKKFNDDASGAVEATTDFASFRTQWGKVMGNCGTCHKQYRKKK